MRIYLPRGRAALAVVVLAVALVWLLVGIGAYYVLLSPDTIETQQASKEEDSEASEASEEEDTTASEEEDTTASKRYCQMLWIGLRSRCVLFFDSFDQLSVYEHGPGPHQGD